MGLQPYLHKLLPTCSEKFKHALPEEKVEWKPIRIGCLWERAMYLEPVSTDLPEQQTELGSSYTKVEEEVKILQKLKIAPASQFSWWGVLFAFNFERIFSELNVEPKTCSRPIWMQIPHLILLLCLSRSSHSQCCNTFDRGRIFAFLLHQGNILVM